MQFGRSIICGACQVAEYNKEKDTCFCPILGQEVKDYASCDLSYTINALLKRIVELECEVKGLKTAEKMRAPLIYKEDRNESRNG